MQRTQFQSPHVFKESDLLENLCFLFCLIVSKLHCELTNMDL